jgi:hypothetical protein
MSGTTPKNIASSSQLSSGAACSLMSCTKDFGIAQRGVRTFRLLLLAKPSGYDSHENVLDAREHIHSNIPHITVVEISDMANATVGKSIAITVGTSMASSSFCQITF